MMSDKVYTDTATILGKTYKINKSSLVLNSKRENDEIFSELRIEIGDGTYKGWYLLIDYMPVLEVKDIRDLYDARLHFDETSGPAPDDTLGSDPNELVETSGWFLGEEDEQIWKFKSLMIIFDHLSGNHFRLHMECQLYNWEDFDIQTKGEAIFEVEAKHTKTI